MFRTLTPRQLAFDITLASFCFLVRLYILIHVGPMIFVVLLMAAALALRRLSPTLALGTAWIGAIVQLAAGLSPDVSNLAILAVLYATAAYGGPRTKWIGLVSAGAGALVATTYLASYPLTSGSRLTGLAGGVVGDIAQFLLYIAFVFGALLAAFGLSWTLGLLARTRSTAREARIALQLAEQEEMRARQDVVVEQERNRIARDMHDVVAHSLAVVIAQADGARYAQVSDPAATEAALITISATAREALGDVRILLGQLRHNQGQAPQPVLADLDRMLDQLRASGLTIGKQDTGEAVALGTSQQLAVYRIVQESLTNALRHGDSSEEVRIHFQWAPSGVELSISSALSDAPAVTSNLGHGLVGMRERAALVGGWLMAEPTNGRFIVTAGIPREMAS